MAGIPDELIEEIRAQADLVQIVGEHVPLRRSGRTYRGPCPLHGGEKPNFSVDPTRGIFKCFVCGAAGDVFSFPMKRLGLDFLDAVRYVAERSGIVVPERGGGPEADPHRDLREAVAFAADWYRRRLWESDDAKPARDYLAGREVTRETAEAFGLGYAPAGWRALREAAHAHGIDDRVLESGGLIKHSEKAKEPYDHFRDRLIFPIEDLRGRPVGFGGRALRDDAAVPKYLNSPDTPIFHKGRLLYGLSRARGAIRRDRQVLVVEGYMDYLSLAARGIENAVAPLGTGLTREQAQLLARYAEYAILVYDSDVAGLRATFRAGDELLRAGLRPHVATLPPGEDPDSVVRRGGPKALKSFLDAAVDVLDSKIQILGKRGFFESTDGKQRALDALLPTVRAAAGATRDLYVDRVAQVTGVHRDTLERQLRQGPALRRNPETPGAQTQALGRPPLGPERNLLVLMLRDPAYLKGVAGELRPDDFETEGYREIYSGFLAWSGVGERPGLERGQSRHTGIPWSELVPTEWLELVYDLKRDPEEFTDPERILRDSLDRIVQRRLKNRRETLKRQLALARTDEEKMKYLNEIYRISQTLRTSSNVAPEVSTQ